MPRPGTTPTPMREQAVEPRDLAARGGPHARPRLVPARVHKPAEDATVLEPFVNTRQAFQTRTPWGPQHRDVQHNNHRAPRSKTAVEGMRSRA